MAEEKKVSMTRHPDGSVEWAFNGAGSLRKTATDSPDNVRDYFTMLGFTTASRNATIGTEKGSVGTPAEMAARMAARWEQWMQGILRVAPSGEEKPATPTLVVEAALIYQRMRKAIQAGADPANPTAFDAAWQAQVNDVSSEEMRAKLEALDDSVTNEAAVEAARAKAIAEGKDGDEAAKKATVTKLDELRASELFKLAYGTAKKAREAAKEAETRAKLAAGIAKGADI